MQCKKKENYSIKLKVLRTISEIDNYLITGCVFDLEEVTYWLFFKLVSHEIIWQTASLHNVFAHLWICVPLKYLEQIFAIFAYLTDANLSS